MTSEKDLKADIEELFKNKEDLTKKYQGQKPMLGSHKDKISEIKRRQNNKI